MVGDDGGVVVAADSTTQLLGAVVEDVEPPAEGPAAGAGLGRWRVAATPGVVAARVNTSTACWLADRADRALVSVA